MAIPKTLVIDRAKWGYGSLVRDDGRMCCLGHLGAACGVPISVMKGNGYPVSTFSGKYPKGLSNFGDFGGAEIAATINDSETLSVPEKERRIKLLFEARAGIAVKFVGSRKDCRVHKRICSIS